MKKVAIIIVTWKGMKWIDQCITSILQSQYPATIFIIDNASPDETPNYIAQNYPEVKLTKSNKNLGFGKANNIGIQQALKENFDYYFLLNQDAYIMPDTINELLKVDQNKEYAIISPIHMNGNGSHVDFYFRDFVLSKCSSFIDDSILNNTRNIYNSDFIPAAAWFIPKRTILTIGGFDPLFFHYGEDDNYCYRVKYHKQKIVFTPHAKILHDRESTVGNIQMYNWKKHYRYLVQDCCNINLEWKYIIQKIGRQFYDDIGIFFTNLITGKWASLHFFINDYIKLIVNIKKIKNSRTRNKKLNCNWLEL